MLRRWPDVELEELAVVERGRFSARPRNDPKYYGGDIPFIQTGDVVAASGRIRQWKQSLNEDGLAVSKRFPAGTIFVTIAANIGDVATCEFATACPDSVVAVRPRDGVDRDWLAYALSTRKSDLEALATQNAQKNINLQVLKPLAIAVPPLPEQRKIAEILRTWDEAIEACERLIASKQQRLAAARQRMFAATRPGADPDAAAAWEETTLGGIFREIGEANPGLGPESVITVGKYAIRRQVEHFTRSVASANLGNYQLLMPGEFVYDPMSAYYGAIGRYAGDRPGIVSPAYTVIRLADGINPAFIEGLLKSHYIAFELENRSSQGNREGKRRTLRSDEFSSIPFMLPPKAEQDRIAALLGEVGSDLELTTKSRDALQKQKRGLMQKLLTGEWRVKVDV